MTLRPDMESHPILDPRDPPADERFRAAQGADDPADDPTPADILAAAAGAAVLLAALALIGWAAVQVARIVGGA